MTVHRYLVTGTPKAKMETWAPTAGYANWLEGRALTDGRETWLVTVYDEHSAPFQAAARAAGATVERVQGGGDTEAYDLLVGEPGTGWNPDLWSGHDDDTAQGEGADDDPAE